VIDAEGKGVTATVEFLRQTNDEVGQRLWQRVSSLAVTNDKGEYTQPMLAPGDYFIRATTDGGVRIPIYYPETSNLFHVRELLPWRMAI
jgi:hypothetical protein